MDIHKYLSQSYPTEPDKLSIGKGVFFNLLHKNDNLDHTYIQVMLPKMSLSNSSLIFTTIIKMVHI